MMFCEFIENLDNLNDNAIRNKACSVFSELVDWSLTANPDDIRDLMRSMANDMIYIEENDGFGTEGMRL